MRRRKFLGCVTAAAGSYMLAACGGGAGEGSNGGSGAVANAIAKAGSGVSANGTTVPPASSITDSSGVVWTIWNKYIRKNGQLDWVAFDVKMLLWYDGYVYHQNAAGKFFQWKNEHWLEVHDPRMGGTSADGTVVPSANYIIDSSDDVWTLSSGFIYKNGTRDSKAYNVDLLLWSGGMLYHRNTSGQFYVKTWMNRWAHCTDPRVKRAAAAGKFYGINGHYDYPYTAAQTIAALKQLGCTTYRVGVTNSSLPLTAASTLAQALKAENMNLLAMLDLKLRDASGALHGSEAAAYRACYDDAAAIAATLAPFGVTMYECGNELTRDSAIIVDSRYAGTSDKCFNNTNWPILRGALRGMIDGVKSVQPQARCGVCFCVADVAASDMLWDGWQPDGTWGHSPVRWDITTWHNYQPYGDIFAIGSEGKGPAFNLPAYCKARYGVPFMVTEWNASPGETETFRSKYVGTQLSEFYAARKEHCIESVMYYQLTSGDFTFGITTSALQPIAPTYGTFKGFVASNPDV